MARSDLAKQQPVVLINIEKNEVFQKISFDPRLSPFEREERKERAKKLGFSGIVTHDMFYQGKELLVKLPRHWDVLDAMSMEIAKRNGEN